jgi:hypothetical protein
MGRLFFWLSNSSNFVDLSASETGRYEFGYIYLAFLGARIYAHKPGLSNLPPDQFGLGLNLGLNSSRFRLLREVPRLTNPILYHGIHHTP